MPHASLKLIPGVDRNRTPALNEAAIIESNLIRFVPDRTGQALPQKLGGWSKYFSQALPSKVRALWAWADTNAATHLGVASEGGLYTIAGADTLQLVNRSPQTYSGSPAINFSTTSGSAEVKITDVGSNITSFDCIYLQTPISVGGIVLFGFYECASFSSNVFIITSRNVIGQEFPASSTVSAGGATPVFDVSSGSSSIQVTLADHGYSVGSTFPILNTNTVGGVALYGNYEVVSVSSSNVFTISAAYSATSTETVAMDGGNPKIEYYIGKSNVSPPAGYGLGDFSAGDYGTGSSVSGNRGFTITGATCVGTVATFTVSGAFSVPIGSTFTVAGVTPSDYNTPASLEWVVTSSTVGSSSSTITADIGVTAGTYSSGGIMTMTRFNYYAVEDWTLDNWGEYLIAGHKAGDLYYYDPTGGSQYFSVINNAPIVNEGYFVAMPERQIICYGSTFTGIQDPLLVRWCDIGNFTSWIGTVTNQAGSFRIPKGSRIVGGMQGPQQGILWTDLGVWSMQYINQPLIWSFNEIGTGCGLIAQKAATSINGAIYWMGQSQFYRLSGAGVETIPCPVWDVVFQDIDASAVQNIRCATNSRFGEISWFFPTIGSGGEPTKYVKYNTLINQWDYGTLTRTAWIDQSVLGAPIGATSDNYIVQHETSPDADGSAMTSYFQTGYFALQDGDLKTFIDQIWPDMKWGYYDGDEDASVKITFYVADYPGQTPTVHGPYTVSKATTYVTPRLRGRLVSIRLESTDLGSFWRLGNIRYRLQPDGRF